MGCLADVSCIATFHSFSACSIEYRKKKFAVLHQIKLLAHYKCVYAVCITCYISARSLLFTALLVVYYTCTFITVMVRLYVYYYYLSYTLITCHVSGKPPIIKYYLLSGDTWKLLMASWATTKWTAPNMRWVFPKLHISDVPTTIGLLSDILGDYLRQWQNDKTGTREGIFCRHFSSDCNDLRARDEVRVRTCQHCHVL